MKSFIPPYLPCLAMQNDLLVTTHSGLHLAANIDAQINNNISGNLYHALFLPFTVMFCHEWAPTFTSIYTINFCINNTCRFAKICQQLPPTSSVTLNVKPKVIEINISINIMKTVIVHHSFVKSCKRKIIQL